MAGRTFAKKFVAVVCAAAMCAVAAMALSGCSQVQDKLGIVSNSDPTVELTSTLPEGATIEDGVLTVGVNTTNSPYGGKNSAGEVIGLDVDIAAALADELGCKVKLVDVAADGKTAVTGGTVDVALGMTKSGTSKEINYTAAYLNDGPSLFCLVKNMPDDISSVNWLEEPILVQEGSSAAYTIRDALGIDSVTTVATMQEAFEALEAGTNKYFVANAAIGNYYCRDYADIIRVDFLSANDVTPVYGITAASNTELSLAVTNAMNEIISNGTLRVVSGKWLGTQAATLLPGAIDLNALPATFTPSKGSATAETADEDTDEEESDE